MGKSIDPMTGSRLERRGGPNAARPSPIVSMSFRLAIPRQVALQQRLLPLHQPPAIVRYTRSTRRDFSSNGKQCLNLLSQLWGPPHWKADDIRSSAQGIAISETGSRDSSCCRACATDSTGALELSLGSGILLPPPDHHVAVFGIGLHQRCLRPILSQAIRVDPEPATDFK